MSSESCSGIVLKQLLLSALFFVSTTASAADPAELASPFQGVDGGGNTVPGASVPFGFISLGPDTSRGSTSGYDSGGLILGFSHTHVNGTGGAGKYGNFRVTPAIGGDAWGNLAFPKAQETARPGYYAVTLGRSGKQVQAELTATRLVGFHRYRFPASRNATIMLDASATIPLGGSGPRSSGGQVQVIDARHLAGTMTFVGGWGRNHPYTLYFAAEFDRPAISIGRWQAMRGGFSKVPGAGVSRGGDTRTGLANRLGTYAIFDTRRDPVVQLKLAVSFVSIEQAQSNLEHELPSWSFDRAHAAGRALWADALNRIEIEGGSEEQRRTFYSALYRAHVMPHDLTGENVWWKSGEPHYEDFYTIWDTFRTLHPLLTLIQPARQRDMLRSLLDTYRHTGWLPDARIAGATGPSQGGSNGDVLLADAVVKDLGGFDKQLALQALLKDGDVSSPDPMNEGRELRDYLALGYMSLSQPRSASRTLEYAYDDYAIASVAAKLSRPDIAERYISRSRNWSKLWDADLQCIHPRYADGRWLENFDCGYEYPDATSEWWDAPFYEGSSSQYSTFVPHDVAALIKTLGGKERFTVWLDQLFDCGEYNHGNEPDILAPWLYIHAGRADRTAERVRQILSTDYSSGRSGLPGNDDAGTLSSWYVWAAIGLFPNAGQPFYYIGSPIFTRSTIHLEHRRTFVIQALETSQANLFVQSAELNGRPLERAWLRHDEIARGGKLVLHMGPRASRWAQSAPAPAQVAKMER